jgi:hypothetical protein
MQSNFQFLIRIFTIKFQASGTWNSFFLKSLLDLYEFVLMLTCYNNNYAVVNFFATMARCGYLKFIGFVESFELAG